MFSDDVDIHDLQLESAHDVVNSLLLGFHGVELSTYSSEHKISSCSICVLCFW